MNRQTARRAAAKKQARHANRWHPQRDRLLRTWLKWVRLWMAREGAKRRLEIVR